MLISGLKKIQISEPEKVLTRSVYIFRLSLYE